MINRKLIFTRDVEVRVKAGRGLKRVQSWQRKLENTYRKAVQGPSIDLKLWFPGNTGRWIFLANPGTLLYNININI